MIKEYTDDLAGSKYNIHSNAPDENKITRGAHHVLEALPTTLPGSHNLIVYSDIRVLRKVYPEYVKSLLENNEIVLILSYYEHPSTMRQILLNGSNGKSKTLNVEGYIQDGSLVIVDSLASYFNQGYNNDNYHHLHHYEIDKEEEDDNNNNNNNNNNKLNLLSLIRILLNHGIKNNKTGITIFSDMGSFFHFSSASYRDNNDNNNIDDNIDNDTLNKILEYERSIPSSYKDLELKKFCLYHQKDYESHFKSTRQKAQLLDCHGQSILIMDGNNNDDDDYGHNTKNKNN
jgi:hypothetical protein